ncbi:MAG: hypothetical protein V4690_01095 [Patescibacteria group bacterium]
MPINVGFAFVTVAKEFIVDRKRYVRLPKNMQLVIDSRVYEANALQVSPGPGYGTVAYFDDSTTVLMAER